MVRYFQVYLHPASSAQVEHMGLGFDFRLQGSMLPGAGLGWVFHHRDPHDTAFHTTDKQYHEDKPAAVASALPYRYLGK